ncbi:MAG: triose-phosphate isomerase [Sphingomonadales bacterium]|nr:triose-phosphate isomerase [Sphingomonadales bacterium]
MKMRKLIAGNWKMNGLIAQLDDVGAIASAVSAHPAVDTALCIPSTLIRPAAGRFPEMAIGGQDCHMASSGAHTGCISAAMLADAGAQFTIVGHSERRAAQGESDADVRAKALAARSAGLSVIVCVGETEAERDAGQAESVVLGQLAGSVPDEATSQWVSIAYEPVWAIGTGRIPSIEDVAAMHAAIRNALVSRFGADGTAIRILYGGSMNGDNAKNLLAVANVDGGLIGGASLNADKFLPIVEAAASAPR